MIHTGSSALITNNYILYKESDLTVVPVLELSLSINVATSSVHICILLTRTVLKKVSSFRGIVLCNVNQNAAL